MTADLGHLKETCARIEAAIVRHTEDDDTRFEKVDRRERWLYAKVIGLVATVAALAHAVIP